ncbi:divalent zinc/iron transporter [Alkalihalophilus pseudofirmus OF4]|uniref:Divalent zinc/iron transporter n=1 Tax=Alkalihalophilus pseudofirmus (strain ATCC BAA-2126 / JCM 17055 / OF4) TaxID=398511 RepID=D3FQL7_ALKPO|nr:ZIP family metal transporter [Alkalihalophilus pseudofirmus]ADC51387.1 divalent zinc/iron transporter [Alkalihalophilus pseudofirmus OF4]
MESLLIGSLLASLATGAGAIPILFFRDLNHRKRDILLAFAAGIMVAAATFELIPEAMEYSSSVWTVVIGVLLGTVALMILEKNVPHIDLEHKAQRIEIDRKAMLVISAIILHNLPEGLAVGVSYASDNEALGPLIALAVGLQNAPEGLLVALYLVNQKISRIKAFLIATATGLMEVVTAIIGYLLASRVEFLLPYGLAFAAGAMLFIVYKELIPESHGDGNETVATYAFIFGLLSMLVLVFYFG